MSPLPQRKKSAEEIAQLRETLGVPSDSAAPGITPRGVAPSAAGPQAPPAPAPPAPAAKAPPQPARHSLQATAPARVTTTTARPEIRPVAAFDRSSADMPQKMIFSAFEAGAPAASAPATASPTRLKVVHSLRKSEQGPVRPRPSAPARDDSPLPVRRRSAEEIEEMRKREAMAMLNPPPPNPKLIPAHPAAILPGYLSTAGAASCFVFDQVKLPVAATCAAIALLIALLICILRPVSKHHSGFIAATTLLVIIFGALHYFPHLRHAT